MENEISGHRRFKGSSSVRSLERSATSGSSAIRISTKETEIPSQRRSKRSSPGSSEGAPSDPSWVILNRVGARKDFFRGDRTTSAISSTSTGEQISVSFKFVEPPGTSLLTVDWPRGPDPMKSTLSYPHIVAAHRDAVLFHMTSRYKNPYAPVDYFVYQASSGLSKPPSLSRLPICYRKGTSSADRPRQRIMSRKGTGLLSWSTKSFIVAEIETRSDSLSEVDIYMFLSGSACERWEVFKRLPVHNSMMVGCDLFWWSTDAVLAFRDQYLIWVDYFRGMIIGNMGKGGFLHKPDLQYLPLPVVPPRGDPDHNDYGRGCPEASRSLCRWQQPQVCHG